MNRIWLKSFWNEFWYPFKTWKDWILKVIYVILVVFGLADVVAVNWFGLSIVWLCALEPLILLFGGSIGYAIAKARSAKIILDDLLTLDDGNHSIRLRVKCEGNGEIEPQVIVKGVFDANGKQLLAALICDNYVANWAESNQKVKLSVDGKPIALANIFYTHDGLLCIYRGDSASHIVIPADEGDISVVKVSIRAIAPDCYPVEKDYWIKKDTTKKTGYIPFRP